MTTPEGPPHGSPGEQDAERPAWGRPPAGGWGGAAPDPAEQTRSWSESGADPDATRVEQPGVWGGTPQPGAPHPGAPHPGAPHPEAPAWAQQPPPAGGWNAPPGGAYPAQPYPPQPYPPQPYSAQPYPGQPYPGQQPPWGGRQGPQQQGPQQQGPQQQGPQQQGPQQQGPQQQGPQQPGPQWGPGYPPLPDVTRPPARSRLPLIIGAVVVVLLGVGAVLAFVTPGFLNRTVFDQAALQGGVQRVLTDDYGYPAVGEVLCGDPAQGPIQVVEGATFTCATTLDGAPATVPVRVTSGAGDYEVSRPPS